MIRPARQLASALLLISVGWLASCGSTPPAPQGSLATAAPAQATATIVPTPQPSQPAPTATPDPTELMRQGIEATLRNFEQAFNNGDASLLSQAIDPASKPLKIFMSSRLEVFGRIRQPGEQRQYTLQQVGQPQSDGFVLARIANAEGEVADVSFRQVGERWLMAEPTVKQLGERATVETEHMQIEYYAWSAPVLPELTALVEHAYVTVHAQLERVPAQKPIVSIKPIYGLGPLNSPAVMAYYERRNEQGDRLVIADPRSYIFGFYNAERGWQAKLEQTVAHEYTHMVVERRYLPNARLSPWMSEGLADDVANALPLAELRGAIREGRIIPIIDTASAANPHDLQHMDTLDESTLAYGFSAALVRYIRQTYGDAGFWRLAEAYSREQDLDRALQQTLGINYSALDAGWRAWLSTL